MPAAYKRVGRRYGHTIPNGEEGKIRGSPSASATRRDNPGWGADGSIRTLGGWRGDGRLTGSRPGDMGTRAKSE